MSNFSFDSLSSPKIHVWCADVEIEPNVIHVGFIYFAPYCYREKYDLFSQNDKKVFEITVPSEAYRSDNINLFVNRSFEGKCLL